MRSLASLVAIAVAVLHVLVETATGLMQGEVPESSMKFDVMDFGAVGDGIKDDSEAFLKAWSTVCSSSVGVPTLFAPEERTYLVHPITFMGPCRSSRVEFQIAGEIMAPENPSAWNGLDSSQWLFFENVSSLTVWGHGHVNGRGQLWWSQSCKISTQSECTSLAPTAMKFRFCNDLRISGITITDSAQTHITMFGCDRAFLSNFTLDSPRDSPNTDGVHFQACRNVRISSVTIRAGDDCISIGDQVFGVNITSIVCGPGHGISIGSLGKDGSYASVEDINIRDVQFVETTNGARIKTWQGGKGYVRSISFEDINVTNVENPIIIDQYYCNVSGNCPPEPTAVRISNVTYKNVVGTSTTPIAVSLNCSRAVGCSSILLDTVDLRSNVGGGKLSSLCINAHGKATGVMNPPVECLS